VTRDESEKRLAELGGAMERALRERSEKLEIQLEATAAAQRSTADGIAATAATLQKQLDDTADATDSRVSELRTNLMEKNTKMEQQLEWYMRYSKTLSTLLGACNATTPPPVVICRTNSASRPACIFFTLNDRWLVLAV
jgi:septal ring factor EnvC (AmiA/AmiB activator)